MAGLVKGKEKKKMHTNPTEKTRRGRNPMIEIFYQTKEPFTFTNSNEILGGVGKKSLTLKR